MTLSEPEIKRWETLIAEFLERRRPPPRLRKDVDLSFRIKRQSVEIFEIRSHWTGKGKPTEHRIAKAMFMKCKQNWKVLREGPDLKWRSYEPHPEAQTVEEFLAIIQNDDHDCFFG
jgi:hypothetical protein